MKNLLRITFVVFSFAIIFYSCEKNDEIIEISKSDSFFNGKTYTKQELNNEAKKISEDKITSILNTHFGILEVNKISKNSKINLSLELDNNYSITEYVFENSSKRIYLAQNMKDTNMFLVFNTTKENSQIKIVNKQAMFLDEVKSRLLNNVPNINSSVKVSLCQRESGESQSECEDREYDEFVESCFVCWVSYWTNPQVPILISALCLCQEKEIITEK